MTESQSETANGMDGLDDIEPSEELRRAMGEEGGTSAAEDGPVADEPTDAEAAADLAQSPEQSAEPLDPVVVARRVEAVLMSVDRPMPAARLAEVLGVGGVKAIHDAVKTLNREYKEQGRSFGIEQLAGGYQMLTLPEFHELVASLHRTREDTKLSPAALETLAIVAYRQPIMRSAIEAVRGVACGEVLRVLMEHHLVKIVGRAEEIGRPMLYGTTKRFLELFGLASLKDLPKVEEFKR
jgi:segregation and condensation protein B